MKRLLVWSVSLMVILSLVLASFGCSKATTTTTTTTVAVTTKTTTTSSAATTTTATTTTTTTAIPEVRGISKDTIIIGNHSALTGAAAQYGNDGLKGLMTAANAINDAGGIYGRKIKIIQLDDKYDVTTAIAAAKLLVEQNKVFAVVGNVGSAINTATADYYNSNQVPDLFPSGLSAQLTNQTRPYVYMVGTDWVNYGKLLGQWAIAHGFQKVAFIRTADSAGDDGQAGMTPVLGSKLVSVTQFASSDTDLSSQVLAAQKAGADLVINSGAAPICVASLKAAATLGYKPTWMLSPSAADASFGPLAGAMADGAYAFAASPSIAEDVPGVKQMLGDSEKYYPGYKSQGFSFINCYLGVKMIANVLQKIGPNFTMADFVKAMDQVTNYDTGGLFPPITFTPTNHYFTPGIKVQKWNAGALTVVDSWYQGK